jgi:hypothetical protein
MKTLKTLSVAIFITALLFATSSCAVRVSEPRHDHGRHNGWFHGHDYPSQPQHPHQDKKSNSGKKNGNQKHKKW